MKRRDFLKTSAILGAAASAPVLMPSCQPASESEWELAGEIQPRSLVLALENQWLKVSAFSDGTLSVVDKANDMSWETLTVAMQDSGAIAEEQVWARGERTLMEQYPVRFICEKANDKLLLKAYDRQMRITGAFFVTVSLEDKWLKMSLSEIDERLPSLVFPPPFVCESLVIPSHAGEIVRKPQADIWERKYLSFFTHLNMRWFGGQKADHAWLCMFDDQAVDAGAMMVNNTLTACWLKSLGQWKGSYALRYTFVKGNYVTLAKTFRQALINSGRFRSLQEKIKQNPALEQFKGGRTLTWFQAWPPTRGEDLDDFLYTPEQRKGKEFERITTDFTHQEVQRSLAFARSKGFTKGLAMLRGWISRGYDASHPDIWPPEPLLGSLDEFQNLLRTTDAVMGLHDNYQDMYRTAASYPKGIIQNQGGQVMHGGLWAGGQAFILNSRNSVEYARRNLADIKTLGAKAMFIDTTTASNLHQSWEKGNELTRLQDMQLKTELLDTFRQAGFLVGSEEGCDFGTQVCDWFESRHARKPGHTVPLWSLVFHDSTFMSRYTSFEPGSPYPKWLEDMLWGYQLQFFINPAFGNIRQQNASETVGFGANAMSEELFTSSFHVDKWHEQTALAEMLTHEVLSEDGQVEATEFSSGQKIVVNFGDKPQEVLGKLIPATGYLILD